MFFTPGPNNATAMAVGLSRGFRAAMPHCLAVTFGGPAMLLLTGAGLGEIFVRHPIINEVLKYLGSAYMLWLAWRISGLGKTGGKEGAASAASGTEGSAAPGKGVAASGTEPCAGPEAGFAAAREVACGKTQAPSVKPAVPAARASAAFLAGGAGVKPLTFAQGLVFQLVNPKAWLTCVSGVSMYAGADAYVWQRLWIMTVIFMVLGFLSLCTWAAGGVIMSRFLSSEGMRRCNYVFAGFLALSVGLLFL